MLLPDLTQKQCLVPCFKEIVATGGCACHNRMLLPYIQNISGSVIITSTPPMLDSDNSYKNIFLNTDDDK